MLTVRETELRELLMRRISELEDLGDAYACGQGCGDGSRSDPT